MLAIRRDVDDMKLGLKALDAVSSELQALKLKVSLHSERLASREEYKDSIARLQAEITQLKMKLGVSNTVSHVKLLVLHVLLYSKSHTTLGM